MESGRIWKDISDEGDDIVELIWYAGDRKSLRTKINLGRETLTLSNYSVIIDKVCDNPKLRQKRFLFSA